MRAPNGPVVTEKRQIGPLVNTRPLLHGLTSILSKTKFSMWLR